MASTRIIKKFFGNQSHCQCFPCNGSTTKYHLNWGKSDSNGNDNNSNNFKKI